MAAQQYGKFYWGVKTGQSPDGEIYLHADKAEVVDGCLVFTRDRGHGDELLLALAPGQWFAVFAASTIDGHPVAAAHWAGEVDA